MIEMIEFIAKLDESALIGKGEMVIKEVYDYRITRCKDCAHWTKVVEKAEFGLCDAWHQVETTWRNDFCSKAGRNANDKGRI